MFYSSQTSLKSGLVEEGSEGTVIIESQILASFTKPHACITTQLLTMQDTKVRAVHRQAKTDVSNKYIQTH